MKRLTERDEYGNANIIGVDSGDLQLNLTFEELNRVTKALNKLADYEDDEEAERALMRMEKKLEEMEREALGKNEDIKMKIYISGAITGTDDYMERFAKAQEKLEAEGNTVVNPALVNSNLPKGTTYDEYMSMSFRMLDMCDAIYMIPGWEKSRGANQEFGYALGCDKIIVHGKDEKHGK